MSGQKTIKAMNYFIQWIDIEPHVFTRVKLLQIFTKVLPRLDSSIYKTKNVQLAQSLMRCWHEKKVYHYVTTVLIVLWQKCGDMGKWSGAIAATLKFKSPMVKAALWGFLADVAETDPVRAKKEWKKLLKSCDVLVAAIADTDNGNIDTKKAAIRFISSVAIFMAKNKDKTHKNAINALCDEESKKKSVLEKEKKKMRAVMKKNAKAIKEAKERAEMETNIINAVNSGYRGNIGNDGGMDQKYDDYDKLGKENEKLKKMNEELRKQMEEKTAEMGLKAAMVRSLKEQNEKLLRKKNEVVEDSDGLREQMEVWKKKYWQVNQENNRLKKDNGKLSEECKEFAINLKEIAGKYERLLRKVKGGVDEKKYMEWDADDVTDWIVGLDVQYEKYEEVLRENLKNEEVEGGLLGELDKNDLHRLGVNVLKDKIGIMKHIQRLTRQNVPQMMNNEMNEGIDAPTAYL